MSSNIVAPLASMALLFTAGAALASPVRTSDFFAGEKELTRATLRMCEAIELADAPDKVKVTADLKAAMKNLDEKFTAAKARGVGPLAGKGNPARERGAAFQLLRSLVHYRMDNSKHLREMVASLRRPKARYSARDLVGVPLVKRGDPTRAMIALTFDDGPQPPHTSDVLDTLARHGVKATFFVVGQMLKAHPKLFKRVVAEGHEIAHHSYTHPRLTDLKSEEIQREIERTDAAFAQVMPELGPITMFRMPFQIGSNSKRVQEVLGKRYDFFIDWTVDSKDYAAKSVQEIIGNTLEKSKKNGAIVLFHDRRPFTADAVDAMIPKLRDAGFQFGTVSEVMGTDPAGRRLDDLVLGLQRVVNRKPKEAARSLGNFTLSHPDSAAAPSALFTSYYLARWVARPKAEKLREALIKRYPTSIFALFLEGKLASSASFEPGGQLDLRQAKGLPALMKRRKRRTVVPVLPAADSPFTPSTRTVSLPPKTAHADHGKALAPVIVKGRLYPAQAQSLRKRQRRGNLSSLEIFRMKDPTPMPAPYRDPQPQLNGSHMIDPSF